MRSLKGQSWYLEAGATVKELKQQLAALEPSLASCKLFLAVSGRAMAARNRRSVTRWLAVCS